MWRAVGGRGGWWLIGGVLLLGAALFLAYYPSAITIRDEWSYILRARLIVEGPTALEKVSPFSGESFRLPTAEYPVGTSLLMSPFVWLAGWRGAFCLPFLGLVVGVVATARWIEEEGGAPLFALVVAGFPSALVISRTAMSDAPSLGVVALGLWLFWRGQDRARVGSWLAASFLAGASTNLREGNLLVFAPFFVGCLLRRDRATWALVLGGSAGIATRLAASAFLYGDAFHARQSLGEDFALSHVSQNLPLHALALLGFVPGGLLAALAYRGRRRPELMISALLLPLLYLSYRYSALESGPLKRIVLGHRYFLPLLPVLAFALAEAVPRLWRRLLEAFPAKRRPLEGLASLAVGAWVAGVALAMVAVHPVHAHWGRDQALMRDEIRRRVGYDSIVITNWYATSKFYDLGLSRHAPMDYGALAPEHMTFLRRHFEDIVVVLLDRSDSDYGREETARNAAFVARIEGRLELVSDLQVTDTDRLRIWRLAGSRPESPLRKNRLR